jgi:hypothetical protein
MNILSYIEADTKKKAHGHAPVLWSLLLGQNLSAQGGHPFGCIA